MSLHSSAVFKNSCLKVPVDPQKKRPTAEYERRPRSKANAAKHKYNRDSFDSVDTDDIHRGNDRSLVLQEFYNSIPDYKDLTHLSSTEFYSKLETLKEQKRQFADYTDLTDASKYNKSELNYAIQNKFYSRNDTMDSFVVSLQPFESKYTKPDICIEDTEIKITNETDNSMKEKRNNSACSITWDDNVKYRLNLDKSKLDVCAMREHPHPRMRSPKRNSFKSQSVPSSPTKTRSSSPDKRLTVPRPFKMTQRDEDDAIIKQLQGCTKTLSEDLLPNKTETKSFKANPVPIESRILLYDKILQDQEMRRALTKINSTAELQSKMKPFSFTEKDECRPKFCSKRFSRSQPQLNIPTSPKKEKHFKAKPVPKHLFSNYVYDKMREDDFYRALSRRIRAEELLRVSSLPPSMAEREKLARRSVNSTPCCHRSINDTVSNGSGSSASHQRSRKSKKNKRKGSAAKTYEKDLENLNEDFVSTSPHPFNFKTANRIGRRAVLKKIYAGQSIPSDSATVTSGTTNRPQSAFDVRSINRSNLAAILRIESAKKKIEDDLKRKIDEEKFKSELKWKDNILRKKPAWQTLKYSQDEDIAMRLQTRRDEEKLRREQFLHEMELMYGRVQQQPLLFERYYPTIRKSRKVILKDIEEDLHSMTSKIKSSFRTTPSRSRKVSVNDLSKSSTHNFDSYHGGKSNEKDDLSDSDEVPESIYGENEK